MKTTTLMIAAVVAAFLWKRGADKKAAANKIDEATPSDGTNWTGDLWSRLNGGADLQAPISKNLDNSLIADPGKVGQASLGLTPSWNGGL